MATTPPWVLPNGGPALPIYPPVPGPDYVALPAIPRPEAIRVEVEAVAKQQARKLAQELGLPDIKLPPSPWDLSAETARQITSRLGIPIPTKLSLDGLLQGAAGLPGLPFPIPTKLPTDADGFLRLGLQTAAQYFGPQLFAAVGLGAVAPGVGNAVAVVVALVRFIADVLGRAGDPRSLYRCGPPGYTRRHTLDPKYGINTATPLLALAYRQLALSEARRIWTTPSELSQYEGEKVLQCITDSEYLIRYRYYPLVEGSAATTILPQALLAKELFARATAAHPELQPESLRIQAEVENRLRYIQWLMGETSRVTGASLPQDRVAAAERLGRAVAVKNMLLQEASNASVGSQLAGSTQPYWQGQANIQFALATSYWQGLRPYIAQFQKLFDDLRGGRPPQVQTQAEHDAQMRRWQEIESQPPTFVAAPSVSYAGRYEMTFAVAPSVARSLFIVRSLRSAVQCEAFYAEWARANPFMAECIDAETKRAILGLCALAGEGTISPGEMISYSMALVAGACARVHTLPRAVAGGFRGAMNPFRLRGRFT